jgi:hypothetical protein
MFLLSSVTVSLWSTQPSIHYVLGALSPGVDRQWSDLGCSPVSSGKIRNCGAIPPLPHTALSQIKHTDNFTFFIILYRTKYDKDSTFITTSIYKTEH